MATHSSVLKSQPGPSCHLSTGFPDRSGHQLPQPAGDRHLLALPEQLPLLLHPVTQPAPPCPRAWPKGRSALRVNRVPGWEFAEKKLQPMQRPPETEKVPKSPFLKKKDKIVMTFSSTQRPH